MKERKVMVDKRGCFVDGHEMSRASLGDVKDSWPGRVRLTSYSKQHGSLGGDRDGGTYPMSTNCR